MSEYKDENIILKLSFEFSLEIILYCELLEEKRKYNMARQLWRSGTAIGAMVHEAQNAESKADFIHKMKLAAKEGDETDYWLKLCYHTKSYPSTDMLIEKCTVINKVLNNIISSSKKINQLIS